MKSVFNFAANASLFALGVGAGLTCGAGLLGIVFESVGSADVASTFRTLSQLGMCVGLAAAIPAVVGGLYKIEQRGLKP